MIFLTATAGFAAGFVHVLAGPDHLAAVAPLTVGSDETAEKADRAALLVGFKWGVGHAAGAALVGAVGLLLRGTFPLEAFSAYAERLVGVMLIAIGLWGLTAASRGRIHAHRHRHGGAEHIHTHLHTPDKKHGARNAHTHSHAATAVGLLHGMAGSSHIVGVLPALALPTVALSVLYLTTFGVGTIIAMSLFSSIVSRTMRDVLGGGEIARRRFLRGCSGAALAVGLFWLVV